MNILTDTTKYKYKLFFIIYFILISIASFFRFPDVKNELKYFVIIDQLIENKDYIILKYFNELYPDKPPLYFWILLSLRKFSKDMFYPLGLIFTSILPASITAYLGFKLSKLYWNEWMAYISTAIFITLPYIFGISLVLRMDYLMIMFIMLVLYTFFKSYPKDISSINIFFIYCFIGFGILVKGGAAFTIPLFTIIFYLYLNKDIKYLKKIRPIIGILIILLILITWFSLILTDINGIQYIKLILGQETIGRMIKSKAHIKPFYFYLKQLPFTLLTLTPFFSLGVLSNLNNIFKLDKWKKIDKISFSIFFPNFIFFSLLSGKLEIYLLPLYYAMIIISLRFIENKFIYSKYKIYNIILFINIFIFLICSFSLPFYTKNYTLKPVINILKNNNNVYSYRFLDAKNISFEINKKSIEGISSDEAININKNTLILVRNKYLNDILEQNFQIIFQNRKYTLLKKNS